MLLETAAVVDIYQQSRRERERRRKRKREEKEKERERGRGVYRSGVIACVLLKSPTVRQPECVACVWSGYSAAKRRSGSGIQLRLFYSASSLRSKRSVRIIMRGEQFVHSLTDY